jgi:hypothetical protein
VKEWIRFALALSAAVVGIAVMWVAYRENVTLVSQTAGMPANPPAPIASPAPWPSPTTTLSEREPTPLLVVIWTPVPTPKATPDVAATATANAIATARAPQVCPADPTTLPKGSICQYPTAVPTALPTPPPMQGCVKDGPAGALCMAGNPVRVIPTPTPYGGYP